MFSVSNVNLHFSKIYLSHSSSDKCIRSFKMHKLHIQMLHFNLYQRQRDHLERKMFALETFVLRLFLALCYCSLGLKERKLKERNHAHWHFASSQKSRKRRKKPRRKTRKRRRNQKRSRLLKHQVRV